MLRLGSEVLSVIILMYSKLHVKNKILFIPKIHDSLDFIFIIYKINYHEKIFKYNKSSNPCNKKIYDRCGNMIT
jgi:hypothetical protein